uniref:Transmembrane protein 106A n=1 Tax=Cavia porcellus TaxID=10141 RepID=A0A286Y4C2_CAVPO
MGEMLSWLGSPEEDEHRLLLCPRLATASCHASSAQSPCSCVPGRGVASGSCVTCPTCQGSGRIPQELKKQLVAVIPYGDQRLKPRHTKLFVSLAVLLCLATTSLVTFSLAVCPVSLNSSSVAFDKANILLNATVDRLGHLQPQLLAITVTQLAIQVLHLSLVVGQLSESFLLHVGTLAKEQQDSHSRIADQSTKICTWLEIKVYHMLLHIQEGGLCSCLFKPVFESFQYVNCQGKALAHRPTGPPP